MTKKKPGIKHSKKAVHKKKYVVQKKISSRKPSVNKHLNIHVPSHVLKKMKNKKIVKLSTKPRALKQKEEFVKTGIPGFDVLLKEGIPKGSSVLVEGGPGSGKTLFCLQTAYNACKSGKKVLYMSFEEPEDRLRGHMKNFGWHPEEMEKKKTLVIKRFDALDIARSVEALLSEAKKELLIDIQPVLFPQNFKPDIVLIDSLTSIASAFSGEESRFRIYMEQLFRYLEKSDITSFLIREVATPTHIGHSYSEKGEAISFLSDGIIVVYNVVYSSGQRGSGIEILKMRGEEISKKIVKMEIVSKKGIVIHPERKLTGDYELT